MQKHHKEEWAELHTAGKQQQSMKSFTAQHSPKKAQSTTGAAHGASAVGVVARPDSSRDTTKHAASETRFAHVKDIFKKQDTGRPVATEGVQGSTEGRQDSMRVHFKPKEQGWDKEQDDTWKEKLAEFITEKYLPLAIVESDSLREMIDGHRDLSSVGLRFCFFGQFSTEGTEVKSASVPLFRCPCFC